MRSHREQERRTHGKYSWIVKKKKYAATGRVTPISPKEFIVPQVVHLWSLERIQKKVSVCPIRLTHLRTNFFRNVYAHATRIRSKPSRRRSSWSKPHLIECPVCGVNRVDFQQPEGDDGSSSSNRSPTQNKVNPTIPF